MPSRKNESDDADILWGVAAIARHIRRSKRQTFYLIQTRRIPVDYLGPRTITASKSKLDARLKGDAAS
jgi:hypothetical protein